MFHLRGPYQSRKWRSHRSKVLGLALDYDIFLLGRALAAASCGHCESNNPTRHMVQGMVQHLSFKRPPACNKRWTEQVGQSNFWRDEQRQMFSFNSCSENFRDSFVLWIDRNDRASRTRSSYAWCRQLLSWVKCWQVQPMHLRVML